MESLLRNIKQTMVKKIYFRLDFINFTFFFTIFYNYFPELFLYGIFLYLEIFGTFGVISSIMFVSQTTDYSTPQQLFQSVCLI